MRGGQTDERSNKRKDGRKSPCVLQDFVSYGAAAQKKEKRREKRRTRAIQGRGRETTVIICPILLRIPSPLKEECIAGE